jgi:hypothetical protein
MVRKRSETRKRREKEERGENVKGLKGRDGVTHGPLSDT